MILLVTTRDYDFSFSLHMKLTYAKVNVESGHDTEEENRNTDEINGAIIREA
jgi:hypothetical protein